MTGDANQNARDYTLSAAEVEMLKGAVLLPADMRRQILRRHVATHGGEALLNLFANFIGLANSVTDNTRGFAETFLVVTGGMHPYTVEKVNFPTIFGALQGADLARGIDEAKTCEGCAYRLGTCANQSPVTTIDAVDVLEPGESPFLCHMELDDHAQPFKACAGYAQARRLLKENAA
jgi:hypothetical protein